MLSINELHSFSGQPEQFWQKLLAFSCQLTEAKHGFLLTAKNKGWEPLQLWPNTQAAQTQTLSRGVTILADSCLKHKHAALTENNDIYIAIALNGSPSACTNVLILHLPEATKQHAEATLKTLQLLADAPIIFFQKNQQRQNQHQIDEMAEILDLLLVINQQKHFTGAAMQIVNDIASRFHYSRVNLGWLTDGYIRLEAISHMENFEKKMAVVNELEAAMEEVLDQDQEICIPTTDTYAPVHRDHDTYATTQKVTQMLSLPLRHDGQLVGVLSCESDHEVSDTDNALSLRVLSDQITPRLVMLKDTERGTFRRMKDQFVHCAQSFLGAEKTLAKMLATTLSCLLLASILVKLPYRVEAPFILQSKDVRHVTAPFSSYIDNVHVDLGQHVKTGQPLLSLDNSDLLLEEAEAVANQVRYQREVEKARARNTLIEMKIAQAHANQALARLELIQHQLARTQLCAPIDGILVEGDFNEQRGRPVEKGEFLCTVAQHQRLYAQINISERDMQDITAQLNGELVFISRPQRAFPFILDQIDPLASTSADGNLFHARSTLLTKQQTWWRPGMSGIAKIDIGSRRVLWIISHRTINFLRLLIWW